MWVSIQHTPSLSLVFVLISPSLLLIIHICIFFLFFSLIVSALKSSNQQQQKKQTTAVNFCESVCTPWSRRVSKRIRLFFFIFSEARPRNCLSAFFFLPFARVRRHCFEVVTNDACLPSRDLTEHTVSVTTDRQHFFFLPCGGMKKKTPFFLACRWLSTLLLGDLDVQFEFPQRALTVFQQTPTHFHEPQYCSCLFHYFFFCLFGL